MRNKPKSKNTFPPPLPSSWSQLDSWILYLLPLSSTEGPGMQVVVSSSQLFLMLLPPHSLPLLQCGVPSTGDSPPWTAPVWVPPMGCSSSWTAPAWVPSMGCSPSGTDRSSMGPLWGHKSCQQTRSRVGSSLHGSPGLNHNTVQCCIWDAVIGSN